MDIKKQEDYWEITCDGTRDELKYLGERFCNLAHENVGKDFILHFNGARIEFNSSRELWMFGNGLLCSIETPVVSATDQMFKMQLGKHRETFNKIDDFDFLEEENDDHPPLIH